MDIEAIRAIVNNPEQFASTALKILDKEGKLVPLKWNSVQKNIFSRLTGRDLILKARQVGTTTLLQGELFRSLIGKTTRAYSLTKDSESTDYLRAMQDRFYKNFPNDVKPGRKYANATLTSYPDTDSSHYIGTAGNTEIGRGTTLDVIHATECAFYKDLDSILAGALQAGNPFIVLESTANGAQGKFYELCMDALAGRGQWNLIFVPYTDFPEYQVEGWKERKMQELGRLFAQEYPATAVEAFLASNTGFFSDIELDYTAPLNAEFISGHRYTAGLDFGQSADFTCMVVVDRTDRKMVDKLHINKMSWDLQRLAIKKMSNKWRLSGLRAEKNSIGSVNIEQLLADGVELEPFTTDNTSKRQIFDTLHEELSTGLLLQDWDVLRSEMTTMTSKQTATGRWTISAEGNAHDDSCIALALAVTAKLRGDRQVRVWK